jgi:hypothetical protein
MGEVSSHTERGAGHKQEELPARVIRPTTSCASVMDPWARGLVRASIRIARREPTPPAVRPAMAPARFPEARIPRVSGTEGGSGPAGPWDSSLGLVPDSFGFGPGPALLEIQSSSTRTGLSRAVCTCVRCPRESTRCSTPSSSRVTNPMLFSPMSTERLRPEGLT